MKTAIATCALLLIAAGGAQASQTFDFTVDGTSFAFENVDACVADANACVSIQAPFHQVFSYTVAGDGDWNLPLGGLDVHGGVVTDFFQNLGTCDVWADDWSTWHDCSHGQLIDEDGVAFGYYEVFESQPGFAVSGWNGQLTLTSPASAVPEPAVPALMLLGGAFIATRRRRK